MPRYYFHLHNGLDVPDAEGKEFANPELALSAARRYARDMVAASATEAGAIDLLHFIDVTGEDGKSLLKIEYGEAVRVTKGDRAL